ncbi:hypothetical protein MPH_12926 [Macrophomina phaseolina MS6]|uniref:Nephrocystin 3-like N-terminal domain-containing protein n=1 Tax=Macrophomina phaseolina (strain MS6) TaxID=1126212 RepID=K2RIP5_MACPH|nr:hypothetical protein MPH_12926 [Macrophomina phaseolina MS6]
MKLLQKLSKRRGPEKYGTLEESDSSDSPRESGSTGLVLLYAPSPSQSSSAQYNIDIVAIHGLGGDLRETWTHKNGTLWLRDLLPRSMPGARIYTYGYPSKIFFNRSVAGIRDFATHLLDALSFEMRKIESTSRPIVYICHSLGGVVFKQAMNKAYDRYPEIWMRSKGVVFLGTPHRGSATADPAKVFGNILNVAWHASGGGLFRRGVKTNLLRALSQNSSELMGIADDFTQRASSLSIATFYEQSVTEPLGSVVVEQSSAVIGVTHERASPLWADHREICRFESEHSDNYKHVLVGLQIVAEDALNQLKDTASSTGTTVSLDEAERACTAILNCVDVPGYESKLDRCAGGTLTWVWNDPQYNNWMTKREMGLLWVTGFPGCGKTIMCSYVVFRLSEMLPQSSIICRFFCNGRIDGQRDSLNLIRSLIYQIVARRRKLLRIVRRASDKQGFQLFDRFDALWNLFLEICQHEKAGSIVVVIDAIDECEEETQIFIADRIIRLLGSEGKAPIKFFVTSRPNAPATYVLKQTVIQHANLKLEGKQSAINEDIKLVIRQRLDALVDRGRCDPKTRDRLQELLMEKADQTFLWVSLVLSLLEMRRLLTQRDLQSLVEKLPSSLQTLYEHLLRSIPKEDAELAGKILRIIVAAARPLSEAEIQTILAISERADAEGLSHLQVKYPTLESIQVLLGPLVRVLGSRVNLIHQSLKDYLVDLGTNGRNPLAPIFGVDLLRDQFMLARSCITYLMQPVFEKDLFAKDYFTMEESPVSPAMSAVLEEDHESDGEIPLFAIHGDSIFKDQSNLDGERCAIISTNYAFFDYASTYWSVHLCGCESSSTPQIYPQVAALCDCRSDVSLNWFRYFWITQNVSDTVPKDVDALSLFCFLGLSRAVQIFIDSSDFRSEMIGSGLYWAARNGRTACVEVILAQKPPQNGSLMLANRQSVLCVAAQCGASGCLRALLASGHFDANEPESDGRTPLSLAAVGGHKEAIKLLLETYIDVNRPDHDGSPPLFWAVAGNATEIVGELLKDKRTDPNRLDRKNRNALSWAAAEGYASPLSELLRDHRIDANNKDLKGRTPLILATMGGHLDNVLLLLRSRRVETSAQDNDGRNAISWAAEQPNFKILHSLLKYDKSGADTQDKEGWTPLAWALNPPGYPQNVDTLVQSGLIDVDRPDRDGRTPLSYAVSYGYLRIVKILCGVKGVNIDGPHNSGRTPLSYAAGTGDLNIVRFLVSTGRVNINARDISGCTPFLKAALGGHFAVITFLAELPGIDMELADKEGRTPLWFAEHYNKEDIVTFLRARCC